MSDSWEKRFDDKFHKRVWNIVKAVNPSSFALAEAYELLEGGGPQIYGEIKEFIRQEISRAKQEQLEEIQKKLLDYPKNFVDTYGYYTDWDEWLIDYGRYIKDVLKSLKQEGGEV